MAFKSFNLVAIAVSAGIFLASCSNTAHIEKAKGVDLRDYKTYSWLEPEKKAGQKVSRRNEIVQQNIRAAVSERLQKKGWKQVENDPDILVSTDMATSTKKQRVSDPVYSQPTTRTYYNPYSRRYNTFYYPSQFVGYDNYSSSVKEGRITVTLIDSRTDKAVWQGWSSKELDNGHMSDKDINKNVKSIFKKFDVK
ncbi:MAG: DUF4136 domain-containing protein [Ferruginibacter sp.]